MYVCRWCMTSFCLVYIDTNECLLGADNCTVDGAAPAQCVNLPGGFRCSCDHLEGYRVNTTDYKSCEGMYGWCGLLV